jgi:tRNA(Ile)-lysidine synthase
VEDRDGLEVARLRGRVRADGLLGRDGVVVAMLSGGRDSVCLLDVCAAVRGADNVCALHVNYRLRAAADADERHCEWLCASVGVRLEVVRASAETGPSGNLQAWARELRYDAARRLAARLDRPGVAASRIATGHTATDQVETILYRLAASPGRRALLGMRPRDDRLVRPLLACTREQTAAYCRERGLRWREDESNDSELFARARVRHRLVTALREVHPAAEVNVLRTAALLREESELLDALVAEELDGEDGVAIDRLARMPAALARLVVVRLAERATGAYVPQAGDRVAEILALARRGGRSQLHVGGRAGAIIEGDRLSMVLLPPRCP